MKLSNPLLALSFAITAYADVALAQWVHDGVALCTAAQDQVDPTIASNGAGGAIVTWHDYRSDTNGDIYAQLVTAFGEPKWTAGGVALCTDDTSQTFPAIVSDGAGGAIVTWYDVRGGSSIHAQRVDADGVPQWTTNGVALCVVMGNEAYPNIAADGAGGAIVVWYDHRGANWDIYAQRVNASGDPKWMTNGVALCAATGNQLRPTIISDGAGGAIVAWSDYRSGDADIYAQRVNTFGEPQWMADGVALCTAAFDQGGQTLVLNGTGGAIVTWDDGRSGTNYDIYAQRVNDVGAPLWTTDGVALCTAVDNQASPSTSADGSGGAIVTWDDERGGFGLFDIYAQRVDLSGVPQWTPDGVALCTEAYRQIDTAIVTDGAGGAIVTWYDERSGANFDIYSQRVNASGAPQWTVGGVPLCTAVNNQFVPKIVSDGAGGAIVTWDDLRSADWDVYAQRVFADGGVLTEVGGTPATSSFALSPNFPNPFSVATDIDLYLVEAGAVEIEVFDVAGRRVRAIELGRVDAGSKRMSFDGRDEAGQMLPSGVYFYRVHANGTTFSRKMVIAR